MERSEPERNGPLPENLASRMEEEVLDKYKVEESNREAFKGGGAPLEWRKVRKNKKYRIKKWGEDCWARIFSLFKELNLQRLQCNQEEEIKQKQRMMTIKRTDKENKIRRKSGRQKKMVGF